MIPKVLHYCWFGRGPLPELAERCIASWRRYLPDYEIRRWDEDSFDVDAIPYTRTAYAAGKYAFVSDYARFWILYRYGGLYFDTDVEVIRPLDDLLKAGPFMGFEQDGRDGRPAVNLGLGLAAPAGMPLYREILDRFEKMVFLSPDGSMNPYTMIPMVTDLLMQKGLKGGCGIEDVAGVKVYPPSWFNPFDDATGRLRKTPDTRSIHWYAKSWLPAERPAAVAAKRVLRRIFGTKAVIRMGNLFKRR